MPSSSSGATRSTPRRRSSRRMAAPTCPPNSAYNKNTAAGSPAAIAAIVPTNLSYRSMSTADRPFWPGDDCRVQRDDRV